MPPKKRKASGESDSVKATRKSPRGQGKASDDVKEQDEEDNGKQQQGPKGQKKSSAEERESKDEPSADGDEANDDETDDKPGQKRSRAPSKKDDQPQKKHKDSSDKSKQPKSNSKATMGSKHDPADAPAPQGSNERLPKKGQKVTWKAMPGWVHGEVLEIVTSSKNMEGKSIKASKDEPRIALKAESGKFCVHKPEACYFEDS